MREFLANVIGFIVIGLVAFCIGMVGGAVIASCKAAYNGSYDVNFFLAAVVCAIVFPCLAWFFIWSGAALIEWVEGDEDE